jgi:hypothetical protein
VERVEVVIGSSGNSQLIIRPRVRGDRHWIECDVTVKAGAFRGVDKGETSPEAEIAERSSSCSALAAMKISILSVISVLGLVLASSCGGTPLSDGSGTGGAGGSSGSGGSGVGGVAGASCEHLEYASPGCGARPFARTAAAAPVAERHAAATARSSSDAGYFQSRLPTPFP